MRTVAVAGLVTLVAVTMYAIVADSPEEPTATAVPAADSDTAASSHDPSTDESASAWQDPPPVLGEAGDLVNLDGWLQTDATSLADIDAPVKIIQFWTFGCYNCKNTLPYLQDIYADYHDQGLEIIGVHAPEFAYEADPANVAAAAVELGVTWPIALDTEKTNFRSWQSPRRFWPRTFVVDSEGNIRFDRIGEGAYEQLEATVAFLIDEAGTGA